MGEWKHAGILGFPIQPDAIVALGQTTGTIQLIVRFGETLEGWSRGSENPFPLAKQTTIPGKFCGTGFIIEYVDGNYYIGWPKVTPKGQLGEVHTFWSRSDEWPDPSNPDPPIPPPPPPPPPDKKLEIKNGKLCYGSITKFVGVSRREILMRAKGQVGGLSPDYILEDYERDIIDSGINYVRHIGVMDTAFLKAHCERMKAHGIIVEVEVYESETSEVRVDLSAMGEIAELGNVFFDVGNEFLDPQSAVNAVIDICEQLKSQGCIVSAGAWGSSHHGEEYSKEFHERYNGNHLNTHHRHWTAGSFQETIALGKPVCFNEYFSQGNLTLDQTKAIMKTAFNMGIHVNYYGFRFDKIPGLTKYDPFDYMLILKYAGELLISE